jgi:hypothetical protein
VFTERGSNRLRLKFPEMLFTVINKNVGDAFPCDTFYIGVRVTDRKFQRLAKETRDR